MGLEFSTYDLPYNFASVMHYGRMAFSDENDEPTIIPKVTLWKIRIKLNTIKNMKIPHTQVNLHFITCFRPRSEQNIIALFFTENLGAIFQECDLQSSG